MSLIRHADTVKVLHEQYFDRAMEVKGYTFHKTKIDLTLEEAKYAVDVLTDIDREIQQNEWNGEHPYLYSDTLAAINDLTENVQSAVKAYLELNKYYVRVNKRGLDRPMVTFSISIDPIKEDE